MNLTILSETVLLHVILIRHIMSAKLRDFLGGS